MSALRRTLTISTLDGTAFAVMVGVGETYLPAFVIEADLGEVAAGLVMTVPLLAGALAQLASPWGVRVLGNLRRWVSLMAAIQGIAFLPLALMATTGWTPAWAVFLCSTLYWGAGMACGAAWTTWAAGIVPARLRARYFGGRARLCQTGVFVGLVVGGLTLEWGRAASGSGEAPLSLFSLLFVAAGAFRLTSAALLSRYHDPGTRATSHRVVGLPELLRRARHGSDVRFLVYMLMVTLTAQVAQPFFTPYMLGPLDFTYAEFLLLLGASFVAKSIAQPLCGRLASRIGVRRVLWLGGIGIVPLPVLWLVSDSFGFLFATQLVAGAAWGAYELASMLLMFEALRDDERTSLLAKFNLGNAGATVAGSLVGAWILSGGGRDASAYAALFVVSIAARLASVLFLMRTQRSLADPVPMAMDVEGVRASAGSIAAPILESLPEHTRTR